MASKFWDIAFMARRGWQELQIETGIMQMMNYFWPWVGAYSDLRQDKKSVSYAINSSGDDRTSKFGQGDEEGEIE